MKTQDLNEQESKNTNGGSALGNGLLGNDNNTITGVTQGYVHASNTDDDGRTSSHNINYGDGGLLNSSDGNR